MIVHSEVLAPSIRPKHRRTMRSPGEPTYAQCTDARNAYDGGCIELCPRHDPDRYSVEMSRHRKD